MSKSTRHLIGDHYITRLVLWGILITPLFVSWGQGSNTACTHKAWACDTILASEGLGICCVTDEAVKAVPCNNDWAVATDVPLAECGREAIVISGACGPFTGVGCGGVLAIGGCAQGACN